jgi:hypothetical protein
MPTTIRRVPGFMETAPTSKARERECEKILLACGPLSVLTYIVSTGGSVALQLAADHPTWSIALSWSVRHASWRRTHATVSASWSDTLLRATSDAPVSR